MMLRVSCAGPTLLIVTIVKTAGALLSPAKGIDSCDKPVEFQFITKDRRIRKFSATVAIIPTTGRSIASLLDCIPVSRSEDAFGKNREEPLQDTESA